MPLPAPTDPRSIAARRSPFAVVLALLVALAAVPALAAGGGRTVAAQGAALSCAPLVAPGATTPATPAVPVATADPAEGEMTTISVGYVHVSIFAPCFVAQP